MNLTAFKVVLRESRGVYHSAIEFSKRNRVYYSRGHESRPNVHANQFLCVFDSLEHARAFKQAVFKNAPVKALKKAAAILEVIAKGATKSARTLDGTIIRTKLDGHFFCKAVEVLKRVGLVFYMFSLFNYMDFVGDLVHSAYI